MLPCMAHWEVLALLRGIYMLIKYQKEAIIL